MAKCFTKGCNVGATVRHRETDKRGKSRTRPFCSTCASKEIFDPYSDKTVTVIDIASAKIINVCKPIREIPA